MFLLGSQVSNVLSFACHHPGNTSNVSLVMNYIKQVEKDVALLELAWDVFPTWST